MLAAQSSATAPAHPAAQKKKKASSKTRRQLAPEPARIKEIQGALAREGFYQGEPTGKWDEATVAAMKSFQESKGLQPTGKIEALSLQKLGLGSPVAGLAPPAPQASAASASAPTDPPKKP
jgi:peptidoglycan hydrolase-like protein with peptidoglycan-binding domain